MRALRRTSIGELCLDPLSIASRVFRISEANWPTFSPNRPRFSPAFTRFLPVSPPGRGRSPLSLPGERLLPRATPPTSPAKAAPPAIAGHFTFPAVFATVRPPLWAPLSTASIPFEATCFTFAGPLPAEVERGRVERERVALELERERVALERARPFEERGLLLDRLPLVERDLDVLDLDLLPVALWAIRTFLPHPWEPL